MLISGDGEDWTWISTISPQNDSSAYYAFDLNAYLTEYSIAKDEDVYVMFAHTAMRSGEGMMFDNVRISDIDPFGPRILSQTSLVTEGEVSQFSVTFDEPVDPSSFTAADVQITLPGLTCRLHPSTLRTD